MNQSSAETLTVLTTVGHVHAVKTFTRSKTDRSIRVEGYGSAKHFTAKQIQVDSAGLWLRKLANRRHSFVVMGEPIGWSQGVVKRRLSAPDGDEPATLRDAPRAWMPVDVDNLDFDPIADHQDGEMLALEILDRLGIKGTRCVWQLTNSHAINGAYRIRLWIRLSERATCAEMKAYAKAMWGDQTVTVDGKRKCIVDMSVYGCAQPIYTGSPVFEGMDDPVRERVGAIAGRCLKLLVDGKRVEPPRERTEGDDENIELLKGHGLYIRPAQPGKHCVQCPWEREHTKGEERDADTLYLAPHYNGIPEPRFFCHHETHRESKRWEDVLAFMGVTPFSPVKGDGDDDQGPPWVYIERAARFYDGRDGKIVDISAFAARQKWANDKTVVTKYLKRGGVSVDDLDFLPGQPRIIRRNGLRTLNTYIDSRIEPDTKMDRSPWIEQMEFMFPDERDRDIASDWMAWAYQHPERRINWALVLYGGQGNGKTSVLAALGHCIGQRYEHTPSSDDLKERFNGWAHGMLLVRIEELMSGDGRYEIAERLKPLITNDLVAVRLMRRDLIKVRNFANVCASTNHVNAIPVQGDDRRYCIIDTSGNASKMPKHTKRMVRLHRWLYTQDGLRAVSAWLAERDVSDFAYSGRAPETEIKSVMREASRNVLDIATDAAANLQGMDIVTGDMLAEYLSMHACDIKAERIGYVAARLSWLPLNAMTKSKRNRVWVGDTQQAVWSPTRNERALREFESQQPAQRAQLVDRFRRDVNKPGKPRSRVFSVSH